MADAVHLRPLPSHAGAAVHSGQIPCTSCTLTDKETHTDTQRERKDSQQLISEHLRIHLVCWWGMPTRHYFIYVIILLAGFVQCFYTHAFIGSLCVGEDVC